MIFNIYYINFPKVYEIKMMLSNVISINKQTTNELTGEGQVSARTKLGINFMDWFKLGDAEAGVDLKGSGSRKVFETFEIKTTKSVILSDVMEKAKVQNDFSKVKEGELIRIDDVKLSLENEDELRVVKFINSGAFKDLVAPGTNGFDMNNLFNSMFKDYAYKIKGEMMNNGDNILIKIPLTFESEFESSYSVDDLFVGKVSVIGLYKGKINVDELKNSFQYFQELGELQNLMSKKNTEDDEIQESHYSNEANASKFYFKSSGDETEFHYIDLLAIVQNVNIQ
ncbi:hypothetical protein MG290_13505 [Flavobacterium sp. CBA20B-1]|uniref:hypothetical protein n=1 Tax=unclassified Flavobacterium TaxID=196869 RepID=UPI002225774E|nr:MULTISPECIES: hypothetical protein [unclassified Flavobacterium]WCM41941.1 hypothetical protein MG290_13505 [Flavobacterium sp. CBA20B-1]